MTAFHLPDRPAWTCRVCGEWYPCQVRRAQLLDEFADAPLQFHVFMSLDFVEAVRELPDMPAGELHARFFGWYRAPERPAGELFPRVFGRWNP